MVNKSEKVVNGVVCELNFIRGKEFCPAGDIYPSGQDSLSLLLNIISYKALNTKAKVDKTNVAIFACRYSDMNTLMQKWQILQEYTIQQIFIFGYPVFCLIIVKLIILNQETILWEDI